METKKQIYTTPEYYIGVLTDKQSGKPKGVVLGDRRSGEVTNLYSIPYLSERAEAELEPLSRELGADAGQEQRSVSYGELVELQEGFAPYAEKYNLQEGTEEYTEALNDYEIEYINSSEETFPTVQDFIRGYVWECKGSGYLRK